MPLVSVVIPLYQTERYISGALSSVLSQTFEDFEVVVIDDESRDRGPEIARSFDDPRVRVLRQANRGLAGARNSGIRESRGKYIALLDADDVWEPRKLELHIAQLEGDDSVDVSFSASRLIDEAGADIGLVQSPKRRDLDATDFFCRNPIGNGSVPVLRRRALDRIEFWDDTLGRTCWFDESFRQSEDVECWMRLVADAQCRFAYVDAPLTRYRVNSSGLSANVEQQLATWRRFRDKVRTYAPDLVAAQGRRAEAYQLRYLARRAVYGEPRGLALKLALQAVVLFPWMVIEEPGRSVATLGAAVAKFALSGNMFRRVEQMAMRAAVARPELRL